MTRITLSTESTVLDRMAVTGPPWGASDARIIRRRREHDGPSRQAAAWIDVGQGLGVVVENTTA